MRLWDSKDTANEQEIRDFALKSELYAMYKISNLIKNLYLLLEYYSEILYYKKELVLKMEAQSKIISLFTEFEEKLGALLTDSNYNDDILVTSRKNKKELNNFGRTFEHRNKPQFMFRMILSLIKSHKLCHWIFESCHISDQVLCNFNIQ